MHATRLHKEKLFFLMFAPALGRESLAPLPFEGGFKQAYLGKNFVVQPRARARRRAAATAAASQAQGLYRTGFADYDVRNYIWRELPAVDPRAHFLASSFALFGADMDEMMNSR